MVSLSEVEHSNSSAASTLPSGLVAVFAGATAGIGEAALKAFAKHTVRPKIYFIGRSREAGDRLLKELKAINSDGVYEFVQADMSLLANVDKVCQDIKSKESVVNVLFMSQGTLKYGVDTADGFPLITGLALYSRTRLTVNLLPLLKKASSLQRVVTVMAGTKEGKIFLDDIPGRNLPNKIKSARGHLCTALTLSLEALARQAPEVSFIHNFPGSVDTDLIRRDDGLMMQFVKQFFRLGTTVMGKWVPKEECGERHAWLCLSARFPAKGEKSAEAAVGTDGTKGSGVYSVDWDGESASTEVIKLLGEYRDEGTVDKVWKHFEDEFVRVTGSVSI
ncbi:hypothetical protein B0J15DRAFT_487700 [Fusarium solani]|uniref:Short-chain dehydrogenase/reductase n=1 Tax=Fusarium solani TaxID=169388 RepID=A0A9P9HZF7_FUSSL|nr:uncharacterized protein B0J15DRAFT_487700 [Fusarium solani]KAH7266046.1 hypothetical protein B0J15DRAFT_487700 [Fusarium solani]